MENQKKTIREKKEQKHEYKHYKRKKLKIIN
jgi:hypothetical protein